MHLRLVTIPLILVSWLAGTPVSEAVSLSTLQADGRLSIKTWIEPDSDIVARQQIQLHIEIVTDTRFTAGTRIGSVEIDDAIVLQREKFATNSTRMEGDTNYIIQQWTLVIYPQRGGTFTVPAIPVHLSIARHDDIASISGKLYTRPFRFTAQIPNILENKESNWVATTRFEVSDHFNKPVDKLKPGDALTRTIRITAENLAAMMLPTTQPESIQGISIYQKTPRLDDSINRGDYLARRTDVLTYVFEKQGAYTLPAKNYAWWNLETGMLESVSLPAHKLKVGGEFNRLETSDKKQIPNTPLPFPILLISCIFVLLLGMAAALWRKKAKQPLSQHHEMSEHELLKCFHAACQRNQVRKAIVLFYRWLDHGTGKNHVARIYLKRFHKHELFTGFDQLMQAAYAHNQKNEINLPQFADQLLCVLKKQKAKGTGKRWRIQLRLNPDDY